MQGVDPTDHALVVRMRGHDEEALASLYDRHAGLVFTLARRIVGDRALAEEVLQDAFFRCWSEAEQYDPARGSVAAWLMGVARNRAIDLLRSRSHQARLRETSTLSPVLGGESPGGGSVLREIVSSALAALSTEQREAIELAYYGGLTQSEISHLRATPLGTVKTRMRSALDRLRTTLKPVLEAAR
jgi:RNA polymerase sigma-70 factor (ECF subfamily)